MTGGGIERVAKKATAGTEMVVTIEGAIERTMKESTAVIETTTMVIKGGTEEGTMMSVSIERNTIVITETEIAMNGDTRNESTRRSAEGAAVEALASYKVNKDS